MLLVARVVARLDSSRIEAAARGRRRAAPRASSASCWWATARSTTCSPPSSRRSTRCSPSRACRCSSSKRAACTSRPSAGEPLTDEELRPTRRRLGPPGRGGHQPRRAGRAALSRARRLGPARGDPGVARPSDVGERTAPCSTPSPTTRRSPWSGRACASRPCAATSSRRWTGSARASWARSATTCARRWPRSRWRPRPSRTARTSSNADQTHELYRLIEVESHRLTRLVVEPARHDAHRGRGLHRAPRAGRPGAAGPRGRQRPGSDHRRPPRRRRRCRRPCPRSTSTPY